MVSPIHLTLFVFSGTFNLCSHCQTLDKQDRRSRFKFKKGYPLFCSHFIPIQAVVYFGKPPIMSFKLWVHMGSEDTYVEMPVAFVLMKYVRAFCELSPRQRYHLKISFVQSHWLGVAEPHSMWALAI